MNGTVTKVIIEKGFGFIRCDGGGEDRFFHFTGLVPDADGRDLDIDEIKVGDRVTFTEKLRRTRTSSGAEVERPVAIGVRILEDNTC